MAKLIVERLQQDGDMELPRSAPTSSSATGRIRKVVDVERSRLFLRFSAVPRLLDGDLIRDTIAKGVQEGTLAYSGRGAAAVETCCSGCREADDVEISDDTFILPAEDAKKLAEPATLGGSRSSPTVQS